VTPIVFVAAALYISASTLVSAPIRALTGLAIILAGVPAYLYWRRR
jgi:APA family basic amino acid/polyamine antiporter